ncbi:MAG: hypothetical protein AAGA29_11170, partial [Planctomycetota bacterium]
MRELVLVLDHQLADLVQDFVPLVAGQRGLGALLLERCFEALDPSIAALETQLSEIETRESALKGKRDKASQDARKHVKQRREQLRAERAKLLESAANDGFPLEGGYLAE